jgi:hypothetical protein
MEHLSKDENNIDNNIVIEGENNIENNQNEEPTFDELYPDEELDDETRNIIFNTQSNFDIDFMNKTHSPKKKKEEKKNNDTFTLQEFIKKDDDKSKKWVSKRTEDKKKSSGIETVVKRKFSPRLPPYKTLKKVNSRESNINVKDNILFPSLK